MQYYEVFYTFTDLSVPALKLPPRGRETGKTERKI